MSEAPGTEPLRDAPEGAGDSSAYRIRVPQFEGPLDLLLHLVRVNEVDITNIPIGDITRQYNEYLDLMRELNLEIAGEYLVMAATLMHIKSRMLLPPDPSIPGEEKAEDPRAELSRQLEEYQRFKMAAENLQAMDSVRSLIWTREGKIPAEFEGEELLAVDLFDLISAFSKLIGRLGDEARLQLGGDDVSVADKIHWLTERLEAEGSLELLDLFGAIETKVERIATFLAMLEMVRLQMVVAFQRVALGEIRIALRPPEPPQEESEEIAEPDRPVETPESTEGEDGE